MKLIMLLADSTTLEGCQFKPNFENSNFQIRSLQNAKPANWTVVQPNGNAKKSR